MAQTIEILDRDDIADAVEHVMRDTEVVSDAVKGIVDDAGYMTESDIEENVQTLVDNALDGLDDRIRQTLEDGDYQTSSDVDAMIDSAFDDHTLLDEDDVERIVSEWSDRRDDALERRLEDLERRFERYATRVDSQQTRFSVVLTALRDLITALTHSE